MENPCLRCHTCAVALSRSDAIVSSDLVASRVRLHDGWKLGADAVAQSKSISVVLQFNDLWLQAGPITTQWKTLHFGYGQDIGQEFEATIATCAILFLRSSRRQLAP
jgi:hypothetical protein